MAKMLFADYLQSIEGTEQEQEFFDNLKELGTALEETPPNIPIAGKLVNAMKVLCECSDVAEFTGKDEYHVLAGWNITLGDGVSFNLTPGPEHKKKIFKVLAIIGGVLLALWLFKRRRRDED